MHYSGTPVFFFGVIELVVFTVDASWKGKERTWSSGGEGERARYVLYIGNEEGLVELENRSCGMGQKKTIVRHCGGKGDERVAEGRGQCLV